MTPITSSSKPVDTLPADWARDLANQGYFQPDFQDRTGLTPRRLEFHRVLLATDGSPSAAQALEWTRFLCERFDAEPLVATIVPSHPLFQTTGVGLLAAEHAAATKIMESAKKELGKHARTLSATGSPPRELSRLARSEHADLIVLGSRGRTGLASTLLGSVVDGVRHLAPCSVLIARAPPPAKRVLIAHDGSLTSQRAAVGGLSLARAMGAATSLLRVVPLPHFAQAETSLSDRTPSMGGTKPMWTSVEAELRFGAPAATILERVKATKADLVAVGSRGYGSVASFLLGSVSRRISQDAPASVFIAKDPPATEAKA